MAENLRLEGRSELRGVSVEAGKYYACTINMSHEKIRNNRIVIISFWGILGPGFCPKGAYERGKKGSISQAAS